MYVLTDSSGERLLAEAEGVGNARFAARTMHDEGQELPILIFSGDASEPCERLVDGPRGAMIQSTTLMTSAS